MRLDRTLAAVLGLALAVTLAAPAAGQVILDADFDDKTVDVPIGTGGAVVGEPISTGAPNVTAYVRSSPFATHSLEIADASSVTSGSATFNFLGDEEVTSGLLTFELDLWVPVAEQFVVQIREPTFASQSFFSLRLQNDLKLYVSDADTGGGAFYVGDYPEGRAFEVRVVFDMDAGTYDLRVDGQLLLDDETHGVVGRGVGSLRVGADFDTDLDGEIYVDDILVTKGVVPVFEDGFESGGTTAWSSVVP